MSSSNVSLHEFWPIMKEVIESGGEFTFYPHGTSMMPLVREGVDQVVLIKADTVKKGDVVFYQRDNGQFVLHRVVKVKNGKYVMCGDNQWVLEQGITDKHVLAKMKAVLRDGTVIDEANKKYVRYIKSLSRRRFKMRVRNFLGRAKKKIFGKKEK